MLSLADPSSDHYSVHKGSSMGAVRVYQDILYLTRARKGESEGRRPFSLCLGAL